jgi:hypothetical protein
MARPKRMGVYNALDDLPPGPAWGTSGDQEPAWDSPVDGDPGWAPDTAGPADETPPPPRRARLEPVPDPPGPVRRRARDRRAGPNVLDDLLPGPRGVAGLDDLLPGPQAPPPRRVAAVPRSRGHGRHLEVWNPLDGPPTDPAPVPAPPRPARTRVGFRLPADLVETARDAVAHLAATPDRTTLTALTERALRVELARLAITHNHSQPFPPRER